MHVLYDQRSHSARPHWNKLLRHTQKTSWKVVNISQRFGRHRIHFAEAWAWVRQCSPCGPPPYRNNRVRTPTLTRRFLLTTPDLASPADILRWVLGSELLCCREQHVLNDSGPLIWLFAAFILFISLLLSRFYYRDCLHVKVRNM